MFLAKLLGQTLDNVVYIVCILVILFFAIAFIWIATLFFNARKKNILFHLEDKEILQEVNHDYHSLLKKKKNQETVVSYYSRKQERNKKVAKGFNIFLSIVYIAAVFAIAFSLSMRSNNQQVWMNDQAFLIVETNSMAQAYSGNTYLKDADGKTDPSERIKQYSLIQISRKQEYIDAIKPFDVVAFQMLSEDGSTYITVIHRLINIDYDAEGNPLYTFRGDANPSTMTGEFQVKKDRIVGVFRSEEYHGYKNLALGYLICYLRSPIGIITLVTAFMVMIIYSILYDKVYALYEKRYKIVLAYKEKKLQLAQQAE